ncbi:hypothetical protein CA267_010705 [Alteromonas pelagimontana]|uniref:Uncharacterized protein n=1 Tax=Alteromonas pelagimontana TaxID=1858656 RepID=A0A6M4MG85_9ALTE|nr:hypothetical protein [Alteromonas pelagimontana]QJR81216.1 hypothetical protein CA267_010705 [Alteromonas pelagimontana]
MDNSPDYTKYSENELVDVINNMDAARYPERFANAQSELKSRREVKADCEKPALPPIVLTPQEKRRKALVERTSILLISSILISLFIQPMFIPSRWWGEHVLPSTFIVTLLATLALIKELFNRGAYYQLIKRKAPRSYLGLLFFPLLFGGFAWYIIAFLLPVLLHGVADNTRYQKQASYQIVEGRKYCRSRIKVSQLDEFEDTHLCISFNSLRHAKYEQGRAIIRGETSIFGLKVASVQFL